MLSKGLKIFEAHIRKSLNRLEQAVRNLDFEEAASKGSKGSEEYY